MVGESVGTGQPPIHCKLSACNLEGPRAATLNFYEVGIKVLPRGLDWGVPGSQNQLEWFGGRKI